MPEQRNLYKGLPERPWMRLGLASADGTRLEMDVLADTGSPCSLIIGEDTMRRFNLGSAPQVNTNFGPLDGGWLQIQIPQLGLDEYVRSYSSDAVVQAVKSSDPDFDGLAGLPLLRMVEYGGDRDYFWVRTP
jgi:hypothetical protein